MGNRGQVVGSTAIANFGVTLAVGAALIWIYNQIAAKIWTINVPQGQVASQSQTWLQAAGAHLPIILLGIAFLVFVGDAVIDRVIMP